MKTVVHRREARHHVDDRARNEERRNLAHAAFVIRVARVLDHRQPADARADAHADALLVAGPGVESGVLDGFHRGDEAVMNKGVVAPRFLRRQMGADVESLDLGGDAGWERRRIEPGDRPDTRARVQDRFPRRGDADADRRNDTQSGNGNAAAGHGDRIDGDGGTSRSGVAERRRPPRDRTRPGEARGGISARPARVTSWCATRCSRRPAGRS